MRLACACVIALFAIGCDDRRSADAGPDASQPVVEDSGAMPDASESLDAGPLDAGPPPEPDAGVAPLEVAFTAPPPSVTHVRGELDLQLVVTGGGADSVELWKDGTILVALDVPFTYAWNTDLESETEHVIEARAIRDGAIAGRAQRSFVVDRTPPRILGRMPAPDATAVSLADAIELHFSEPISSVELSGAIGVAIGDAPLAHTAELATPDTVRVTVTERPDALPATATVTVGGAITDLAGNALGADDAWSFTYPAWVEHEPLSASGTITVYDATIAGDGTIWVAYGVASGSGSDLRAARWNGRAWYTIPGAVREDAGLYAARIRTRASGRPVVAWSGYETTYEMRLAELNGTSWVDYSAPPRSDEQTSGMDLEIEPDGAVVLSRRLGSDEYVVHRYTGTWAQVGATITGTDASTGLTDLLSTPEGLFFTYASDYDCKIVEESPLGWTSPVDILVESSRDSRCNHALLVRSGGDGALYAFIDRRTPNYGGGSTAASSVRMERAGGGWGEVGTYGWGAPRSWVSATASPAGWYGLGAFGGTATQHVVDETLTRIEGDLTTGAVVLERDGQPVIVTRLPSILEINALP